MEISNTLWMALRGLLVEEIARRNLSQTEVAKAAGSSQPRISQILNSEVQIGSSDALVHILESIGVDVSFDRQEGYLTMWVVGGEVNK